MLYGIKYMKMEKSHCSLYLHPTLWAALLNPNLITTDIRTY